MVSYGQTYRLKNYINGKWVEPASRKTINSINPAFTKDIVAKVPRSNEEDVDNAVRAAKKAFEKWKLYPAPKRGEILFRVAELLKENKSKIGDLVAREMGKQKKEAYGDVQEAIDMAYYMAGEARRGWGETFESELPDKSIKTIRQPVGVFALITPWNFPVAIPAWKIFPALVYGNTVVFKPSNCVAACAGKLVELFEQAGLPPGVLNLVHGIGSEVGISLIRHEGVNGVSFTGSTFAGKVIGNFCGEKLRPHSLELGGKNAIIVMDDADLDLAVDGCLWAAFGTTGQRCTAGSRIIVHQKVYDIFAKKLVDKTKRLKLGYALEAGVDVGPLINEEQYNRVLNYIEIGKKEGKLLCGGRHSDSGKLRYGYFIEPTIFANVEPTARIAQEEIFGPVVALIKAKDFNDAVRIANGVEYGLSASIFTKDIHNAEIASRDLEVGLVYVNSSTIGAEIQTPFGGLKGTGNGHREAGGRGGAIDTYTEVKVISVDYSGKLQKAQID